MTGTRVLGPPPRRRAETRPELPCQTSPDLFFAESPDDIRLAKLLCRHCPLQQACLAGALRRGEPWGVWGGALFERGAIIPDKRPRGRPRKPASPLAAAPRSRLASVTAG
jgi:WhiB family transcriptional regulator, redox-sensing transcriptional regulator